MTKQIFLGGGEASCAACYEIHQELEHAFKVLGGIQQPGCSEDDIYYGEYDVNRSAKWIYERLTGRKILLTEQEP